MKHFKNYCLNVLIVCLYFYILEYEYLSFYSAQWIVGLTWYLRFWLIQDVLFAYCFEKNK